MALTKIKLNTGMVTGSLPDANIPDDLTINSAGITQSSGTLTIKNASGDSNGLKIFQDSGDASKIYNHYNGTLQLGVGNTTALTIDSAENSSFAGQANFGTSASFIKQSRFGYSSSYKVLQLGLATSNSAISLGADVSGNSSGGFTGNEILIPNGRGILAPNNANNAFLGVLAVTSSDTIEIGRGDHSIINTSGNAISINTSNNNTTFAGNIVGKTNSHISYSSGNATNTATGGAFNASGSDIVTGRLFIQGYQNTGNDLIGFNNETNHLVLYNYTDGAYLMKIAHGATLSADFGASMLNLYNNDTGSAGSNLKQLSLGDSDSTAWNTTNSGTFTGAIISNSHNDVGTACGIAFSHRTGSSGISYVVSRNEGADASSLHFGTRGTDGVARRMLISADGSVYIDANSNNKASLNVQGTGSGQAPNDAKVYVSKNSSNDWSFLSLAGADDYGFKTKGVGSYAITVTNHSSDTNVFRVEYDGDILASNTSISSISDRRLKKEITNANSQWDDIKALNFVNYKWKKSTGRDDTIKYLGLIADEVESVSPSLIKIDAQSKEDIEAGVEDPEYKTVKYSIVWMKAVKALQEAMAKIETLEAKVEALENGNG